jgi:hypothetical protein
MIQKCVCIFHVLLLIFTLSACGGSGSSAPTTPTDPGTPTTPTNPGTPVTPPANPSLQPLLPEYTGATNTFALNDVNTGETVVSALELLDFLNQIVFDNEYATSLFIEDGNELVLGSQNLVCESGSNQITNNPETRQFKAEYSNCVIGLDTLNGFTEGYTEISNGSERTTLNIDLTITSAPENHSSQLKGHIVLSEQGNIIYNLTVSDNSETIWINNVVAFVDAIGLKLFFQGDIYIASSGKLSISTNTIEYNSTFGTNEFDVDIIGDSSLSVNILQGQSLTISSDNLITPLTLDLINYSGLPENNIAPVAIALVGESVFYNDNITIDGSASTDENLHVISHAWTVLDSVEDANVTIDAQGPIARITADRPGNYKILMTVSDPLGASNQQELNLTFSQRPPEVNINMSASNVNFGSFQTGTTLVTSPIFDGPFEFSLEYAPEGLVLDEDGSISWTVDLPNLGQPLLVNTGVRVTTPSHSIVVEAQVIASPLQSTKHVPVNVKTEFNYKFAHNTNTPIYLHNRSAFEMDLIDGVLNLRPHILPNSVAEFASNILHIADIDADNDLDYLVSEINSLTQQQSLWAIDASGNKKLLRVITPPNDEKLDLDIKIIDLTDSLGQELLLFNRNYGSFHEVLSSQGELLSAQNEGGEPWCDINADGKIDWIQSASQRYRLFEDSQWSLFNFDYTITPSKPRFKGLSGTCDLFASKRDEFGEALEIVSINPFTGETTVIANVADLASQFNIGNYYDVALTELNTDSDEEQELTIRFLSDADSSVLVVDNVNTDNQLITKMVLNEGISDVSEFAFQYNIYDIDNDGVDELLSSKGVQFGSSSATVVTKIEDGLISQFTSQTNHRTMSGDVKYWDGIRGNVDIGSLETLTINVQASEASQILSNDLPYTKLVTEELGQNILYVTSRSDDNDSFFVEKRLLGGTTIWKKPIQKQDDGFIDYLIGEVNESYIILKGLQPIIIHRDSGEIAYRFPTGFRSLTMNDGQHIIPAANNQQYLIGYNDTQLHVVQLMPSGEFVDYPFEAVNTLLPAQLTRASLVQLDNQGALELVVHFEDQTAFVIDINNKQINELEQSVHGNITYPENMLSLFSRCISNSPTCRNSIYGESQANFNQYGNIFAVDAITGDTVWQTQQPFVNLLRAAIARTDTGFKSLIILEDSIVVME